MWKGEEMVVNLSSLKSMQADARALADDLGVVTRDLTDRELTRFGRAFERQFVREYEVREIRDMFLRHQGEALLGAMIAKEQMNAEIDSEQPAPNKIGGPLPIDACYLGIGDDWEDINGIYGGTQSSWSTGSPQNWIHSGTSLLGGTAGNPVRIGENAVHVVFAIGSLHPSPKIQSVQFTIDGKLKPKLVTAFAQKYLPGAPRPVKELDNCYIFNEDKTVLAKVMISHAFGEPVTHVVDYPYLIGVSYIKEPALRLHDPATLPGPVYNVILTT
jgi:hypothetical protein